MDANNPMSGPNSGDEMAAGEGMASYEERVDQVDVLIMQTDPGLELPGYAQPGDAGADLRLTEDTILQPGERRLVGTGIAIALPDGYVGLVHPRSGLAARHGLTVVNTPGTIDAGYRGEIKVCLLNTDRQTPVALKRGDRIAQLVVQRVSRATFVSVSELPRSVRGAGGYGSTGGMSTGAPSSSEQHCDGHTADGSNGRSVVYEGAPSAVQQEQIS